MTVKLLLTCDGCPDTTAEAKIERRFLSFNGRGYGWGVYRIDELEEVAPDGWTLFDLIGATYCPTCTDELFGDDDA